MPDNHSRLPKSMMTHVELARAGLEDYQYPRLPLSPDQQRNIGQISITDGVYIPREAPTEETSGIGWPE